LKEDDMKKKLLLVIGLVVLIALPMSAGAYTVDLTSHEGKYDNQAVAWLDVTNDGTNEVTFDLGLTGVTIADMRAFFFNLEGDIEDIVINSIEVDAVTDANEFLDTSDVITSWPDVARNADLDGAGIFDIGVEFGEQGIDERKGDIRAITFTVYGAEILNVEDDFGLRLMSVGDDREDSLKLLGSYVGDDIPDDIVDNPPETPGDDTSDTPTTIPGGDTPGTSETPEPATMFLLGSGLAGLAGYRKKFGKKK
jgi:hypothetical protein